MYEGEQSENGTVHHGEQSEGESGTRMPEVEAHRLDAIKARDDDGELGGEQGFQLGEET